MMVEDRAALFDIDGTLFDSREAFRILIQDLSLELGIPRVEGRDIIQLLGRPDNEIAEVVIPSDWPDREKFVKRYIRLINERWSSFYLPNYVKTYPGLRETLEILINRGYRIGVVSNGNGDELPLYLKHGGIEDLVEVVVSVDDVPMPKPHPYGLLEACKRLSVSPRHAFYAGDTPADIMAAKAAGCVSVVVLNGAGKQEDLLRAVPDLVIDSISSLPKFLDVIEAMF